MASGRPPDDGRWGALGQPSVGAGLILVLLLISALNPIATSLFVPAIPHIVSDLATSYATVQLALSVYLVASAFPQLLVGPVADRIGRRPVVLAGLVLFIAGCICSATAPSVAWLNVGRAIQGAGACAGMVLGRAVVGDLFGREKSASMLGYITLGFGLAPTLAPLFGGVLDDHFGWRSCFIFLAAIGAVALAASSLFLRETLSHRDEAVTASFWRSTAILLNSLPFWLFAVTGALGNGVFFAFIAATPYASASLFHMSGTTYGAYFVLVATGFMLGSYVTGRFSPSVGVGPLIVAGNICGFVGLLFMAAMLMAGIGHPLVLFGPMLVVNFGNGIVLPNAMAGAISVRPEFAGTAAGLAGTFQIGFGAVAAVLVGAIVEHEGVGGAFSAVALAFSLGALGSSVAAAMAIPKKQYGLSTRG